MFVAREKERTRSLGRAALGGEWELLNHEGKTVKSTDFHGNWVLLYFGFTHCPDVCPDELEKMVKTVDTIGKSSMYILLCRMFPKRGEK